MAALEISLFTYFYNWRLLLSDLINWIRFKTNRSYRYKKIYKSYFTRDYTRKLVIFSIYIVDPGDPIVVKNFLKYREGTLEYDSEFNSLKKNIAIKHYRFLRVFQFQGLYFLKAHQFFAGDEFLREYYISETNNSPKEFLPLREMDSLEDKIWHGYLFIFYFLFVTNFSPALVLSFYLFFASRRLLFLRYDPDYKNFYIRVKKR
jgi:hypothetical protein